MSYEDVFKRRFRKPRGTGVPKYLSEETQMPLFGPIHLWYLRIPTCLRPCGSKIAKAYQLYTT